MDENTQTQQTSGTGISPQDGQVMIGGAFWGTIPTQEPVSETMPSFSFDESEFWGSVQPLTVDQNSQQIQEDPFAGGFESTNISLDDLAPVTDESLSTESIEHNEINIDNIPDFNMNSQDTETPTPQENVQEQQIPPVQLTEEENIITDTSFNLPTWEGEQLSDNNTDIASLNDLSFDLPNINSEEPQSPVLDAVPSFDIPMDTNTEAEVSIDNISFDLPSIETTTENTTNIVEDISSFDIPTDKWDFIESTPEQASFDIPQTENSITEQNNETLLEKDITVPEEITDEDNISFDLPEIENNNINEDTPQESFTNELEKTDEDSKINNEEITDETTDYSEENTISEEWNDQAIEHELSPSFKEFNSILSDYLSFVENNEIEIIGLRTDDEEITYNFKRESDDSIIIKKSTTGDTISFYQEDDGTIEVILNDEMIAHYGVNTIHNDITHYLKEKIWKFTMMISSEYEKAKKAQNNEMKKIKATLRDF